MTAEDFLVRLEALQSDQEKEKYKRYFRQGWEQFIGVRMGHVFALAKEFVGMDSDQVEKLLVSDIHEARAGALSLMGKQYGHKKTPDARRAELFALAARRTDRINNWDLVDLTGLYVTGPHLADRSRQVLFDWAGSTNLWERRLAIVSMLPLVRRGGLDDGYQIAEILLQDKEELVQKGVGCFLRVAGGVDEQRLRTFLDSHAPSMPRIALRTAIENLPSEDRKQILSRK